MLFRIGIEREESLWFDDPKGIIIGIPRSLRSLGMTNVGVVFKA
jgi:hypothetical protein